MSNTAESCKDVLSCPICMETFTIPKMLSCGHSFCQAPCLAEIMKQLDPVCPLCRKQISLPPSGNIEDIPTNFSVKDVLEVIRKTESNCAISCPKKQCGDYVCSNCLEQICSCCQLSWHMDNEHNCSSVSEFTEKIRQDVSKMFTIVHDLPWPEEFKRYTSSSSVMLTYKNVQDNISTDCNEILQLLFEDKLDLAKIKLLHKQIKKNHRKFKEAKVALEEEIRVTKRREILKTQLAEYRQKLLNLKLPKSVYKNCSFRRKISSFENLKGHTEALSDSLTQQSEDSFDIRGMESNLHDMRENIGIIEQYIRDIIQDYHTFLLHKIGVTGLTVEPHHLFEVLEEVEVAQFSSRRHSNDVKVECHELVMKFLAARGIIKSSCTNLLQEFHYSSMQLSLVKDRVVEIVKQMEKCKDYNEDIYEVIGRNFVKYDHSWTKECVNGFLLQLHTFVLELTSRAKTPFMTKHLQEFECFNGKTKSLCKALMREVSEQNFSTEVLHRRLKTIEMRIEKTEYCNKHLKRLLSIEERCHKIMEEFQRFQLTKQTVIKNVLMCCGHKEEVQRIWEQILKHKSINILSDVQVIQTFLEAMEERRNSVVSLLMLSFSQLNELSEKMSKLVQVMSLRARLHDTLEELSNNWVDLYNRQRQYPKCLNVVSEIAEVGPMEKLACVRNYSLQKLLILLSQTHTLNDLFNEVLSEFEEECFRGAQSAFKAGCDLANIASNWLINCTVPEREKREWDALALTIENQNQWRHLLFTVQTGSFDMHVLESRLDRAVSLYGEVNNVRNKIYLRYEKESGRARVLGFLVLVILYIILQS